MPRVLIVDDEQSFSFFLAKSLEGNGKDIVTVSTGEDAIKILKNTYFDIAIVDLRLPGIDGWNVVGFIKGRQYNTKVTLITGYGTQEEQKLATKMGVYYLEKPISARKIKRIIKELKNHRHKKTIKRLQK